MGNGGVDDSFALQLRFGRYAQQRLCCVVRHGSLVPVSRNK